MDNLIGQQLGGRYVVESLLGKQRGRRTFLAQDTQTQQQVVIKLVLFGPDFTWQDLKLFEREAETLKSLDHPAIPKYLDSFDLELDGWKGFALVQTYIDAKSLRQWVESGRTYQEGELRAIATQLLIILSYLHSRYPAVIHRDIKPSNILLKSGADGEPDDIYLVDFGSVHTISQAGTLTVVGTYGYMPPEQFGGRVVPASDLYSLGVTMVYLLSGTHPAERTSADIRAVLECAELSAPFKHCLQGLLHSDLNDRTASASAALQQLTASPLLLTKAPLSQPSIGSPGSIDSIDAPIAHPSQPLNLAHSSLKISKTFYEFEIQFFEDRLMGQLFQADQSEYVFLIAVMVVLVFAGLFYGSGVSFLMAGLLAAFLLFAMKPVPWPARNVEPPALALKLYLPSSDSMLMRVDKLELANIAGRLPMDVASFQRTALLSHLQLINIDAVFPSQSQQAQLSFFFSRDAKRVPDKLSIKGTPAEIEWLCAQLVQWKNLPIERRTSERMRLSDRKLN